MKTLTFLSIGLLSLTLTAAPAVDRPRGTLLELHSCELYAGGCVVSSEATLGGRYMLRAWNFTGGNLAGSDLAGLQVAVLQASSENLAAENTCAEHAVVYLPKNATALQRDALLKWAKTSLPDLKSAKLQTRVVPLEFARSDSGYAFSAGKLISVKTASLGTCDWGGCGEELWYSPRAATSVFTVAVNRSSQVAEPLLKLKWDDARKRSVFLAKFGDDSLAKHLYITSADLCGPAEKLF